MSKARGLDLQNGLARYLRQWWPDAQSTGAGRTGTDITGTPGIVWECKTAKAFRPLEFVRQARKHTAWITPAEPVNWPVTVYWPEGVGEQSADVALAILPLAVLVRLLREAGSE